MRALQVTLSEDASVEIRGCASELLLALQAAGLTEARWRALVQVYLEPPLPGPEPVPMLGTYRIEEGLIRFSPRFPLLEGQRYGVRCVLGAEVSASASFAIPRRAAPAARVTRIYPSGEVLPENILRLYVHFSAPMREGEALRHIRLLDAAGQEVAGAFLDPLEELWDPSGTRLTLLFDPGRVKTGLAAHERMGRALVAGGAYQLVIDRGWRDGAGAPLAAGAEKRFTAGPAALRAPDVGTWQLHVPGAGTGDALAIRVPAPLDQGLLAELLQVRDADGRAVAGEVSVEEGETVWRFVPERPWGEGAYMVQVDARLEDPAGNSLQGLFERPIAQRPAEPIRSAWLRFQCAAGAAVLRTTPAETTAPTAR